MTKAIPALVLCGTCALVACDGGEKTGRAAQAAPAQAPNPAQPAGPTAQQLLPEARVVAEEKIDSPIRRSTVFRVTIPTSTTTERLGAYMSQLYREGMARHYSSGPANAVAAFIYFDGVDPTGAGWIGRVMRNPDDAAPTFDNKILGGALLNQVKRIMLMEHGIEVTDEGVTIAHEIDDEDAKSPREVSDSIMFAGFYTPGLLYGSLGDQMNGLVQTFTYQGKTVGEMSFTRESYSALDYDGEMEVVSEIEAKAWDAVSKNKMSPDAAEARKNKALRKAYRKMLKELPEGSVRINKEYRP